MLRSSARQFAGATAATMAARCAPSKVCARVAHRHFSMPSRADTRPFALDACSFQQDSTSSFDFWTTRTAAGLFFGPSAAAAAQRSKRAHVLSHLIPAASVLQGPIETAWRKSPAGDSMALAILAEQTVSLAVSGNAAAAVLRDGELVVLTRATTPEDTPSSRPSFGSASLALKLGDMVALAVDASGLGDTASTWLDDTRPLLWLKCVDMHQSEVWSDLKSDSPHPSWAQTIFNEYGTHNEKL